MILGMMGILTACGSSQSSLSNRDEEVQRCRFDTIEEVREKVDDEKFYSLIEKVYEKEIESNINKGLLTRQADMLKLSEYGIDICNTVMSDFILTDGD